LSEIFKETSIKKVLAAKLKGSDVMGKRRKLQADQRLLKMKAAAAKASNLAQQLAAKGLISDQNLAKMEGVSAALQKGTDLAREKIERAAEEARETVRREAEDSCMDIMSFIGLMTGGDANAVMRANIEAQVGEFHMAYSLMDLDDSGQISVDELFEGRPARKQSVYRLIATLTLIMV